MSQGAKGGASAERVTAGTWVFRVAAATVVALALWIAVAIGRELLAGAGEGARTAVSLVASLVLVVLLPLGFEHRVTVATRKKDPSAEPVRASALFGWNVIVLAALSLGASSTTRAALAHEGGWPAFGSGLAAPILGAGRALGNLLPGAGDATPPAPEPSAAPSAASAPALTASASAAPPASATAAPSASASPSAPPPVAGPPTIPPRDLPADELFELRAPTVVVVRVRAPVPPNSLESRLLGIEERVGGGSGFVVDGGGLVITNAHVVEGSVSVQAKLADGRTFDRVTVLAVDEAKDLALLDVGQAGLPWAPLTDDPIKIGTRALAIGNPLGLEHSLTDGLISQIRKRGGTTMLQIQTTIAPGSSGGPLFDARGRVIGVTTATQGAGLNYAVHVDHVRTILKGPRAPKTLEAWSEPGVVEDFALEGPTLTPTDLENVRSGADSLAQMVGSCLAKPGPSGHATWRLQGAGAGDLDVVQAGLRVEPRIELAGQGGECLRKVTALTMRQLGLGFAQLIPDAFRGTAVLRFRIVRPAAKGADAGPPRAVEVRFEIERAEVPTPATD